jgi:putative ABC transport system ATP-binding protein
MLTAAQLSKTYYSGSVATRALVDVSFSVEEGDFIAIVGKSGSGKSTLMHLLSLLDVPSSGSVCYGSSDLASLTEREKTQFRLERFGFVFQNYALLSELSATDNVIMPLLMQGITVHDATDRAHDVLTRLGLGERLSNMPNQLSGGEQQRVSIARALANTPEVMFADEPTANLDSETSQVILDYFRELNDDGQTLIMVTHDEEYATRADRIITLHDGRVVDDVRQ